MEEHLSHPTMILYWEQYHNINITRPMYKDKVSANILQYSRISVC